MCAVIKNGNDPLTASVGKKTALNIANFTEQAGRIVMRAHAEAEEILAATRQEAEQIKQRAESELQAARSDGVALREKAHEEGYVEGLESGRRDGLADGAEKAFEEAMGRFDTQCAQLKQLLRDAVMQLDEARETILRQARGEILEFAMEIARRITGLQAEGDVEAARKILARVISSAPCARRMKLRVNAGQYDQLKVYAEDYLTAMGMETAVDVVSDGELESGDVILQTPEGGVDGRVAIQFDNIARALTGHDYIPMEFLVGDENPAEADHPQCETAVKAAAPEDGLPTVETEDYHAVDDDDAVSRMIDQTGALVEKLNEQIAATGSLQRDDDADGRGVAP